MEACEYRKFHLPFKAQRHTGSRDAEWVRRDSVCILVWIPLCTSLSGSLCAHPCLDPSVCIPVWIPLCTSLSGSLCAHPCLDPSVCILVWIPPSIWLPVSWMWMFQLLLENCLVLIRSFPPEIITNSLVRMVDIITGSDGAVWHVQQGLSFI